MLNAVQDPYCEQPFDWTFKGFAPDWDGLTAARIAATQTSLFDGRVTFPTAILIQPVIERNRAWMRNFLALTGASLAPHGKTTLAPDLFRQQAQDGAWAITAATAHHVRLYRRFGVSRILMANQLLGETDIDWILRELQKHPDFEFFCLVDSSAGVDQLAARCGRQGASRPLNVLVEVGRPAGRCGVRTLAEGLEVARAVAAAAPYLSLAGVETFEGLTSEARDSIPSAQSMLDTVVELAHACAAEGLFSGTEILLSAGGSSFFDLAARTLQSAELTSRVRVVLRSGCYITHDDGTYQRLFETLRRREPDVEAFGPGLSGALQVWGAVQSIPEAGQIVCGFGRRDIGTDADLPRALAWARPGDSAPRPLPAGLVTTKVYDQHTVLSAPESHPISFGDLIGFGVSHPCTTFDKWKALLVVDDRFVIRNVVRTYF